MVKHLEDNCPGFVIPEVYVEAYELSVHYVRFRYILFTSNDTTVVKLKNYLHDRRISDDLIARCAAKFYEKASGKVYIIFLEKFLCTILNRDLKQMGWRMTI